MRQSYPRVSTLKTAQAFRDHLATLNLELPCDDEILTAPESPLAAPVDWEGPRIGNRWAIHPMEGWDGTPEGGPTEFTMRRWRRFGESGSKLIWGGEAVAVRHDGRANPNQLVMSEENLGGIAELLGDLRKSHRSKTGTDDDLYVGLQLTHSGRFCRPSRKDKAEPRILFHHPILDRRVGVVDDGPIFSDEEIDRLIDDYVLAAKRTAAAGFQFVDVKHCHGYLGHEFLGGHTREGKYGGSFENRTRFLRSVVEGIRAESPGLEIGVRVSIFDFIPFRPNPEETTGKEMGRGIPDEFNGDAYDYGFGVDRLNPTQADFSESRRFLDLLNELNIRLVNITCGSPYYNPHIQRPALFPPSDGYQPPEDPLVGVVRLLRASKLAKEQYPNSVLVGTGFTYLQDLLPQVGQAVVREGWMDVVGIGRMTLAYPEMAYDSLKSGILDRKRICRTFSDCTTAPRNGMISGCYPLDDYYKDSAAGAKYRELKAGL